MTDFQFHMIMWVLFAIASKVTADRDIFEKIFAYLISLIFIILAILDKVAG